LTSQYAETRRSNTYSYSRLVSATWCVSEPLHFEPYDAYTVSKSKGKAQAIIFHEGT